MSYRSHMSKAITFTPPISRAEYADKIGHTYTDDLGLQVDYHEPDWRSGLALRTVVIAPDTHREMGDTADFHLIEPYHDYDGAGRLVWDLQTVIDDFRTAPDGTARVFTGYIEVSGDEPNDWWRVYVAGGQVIEARAEITWTGIPAGMEDG